MLFKLSVKNIKKSIKDYSIYFLTLVFAVSMFYMFNSIDAQSTMLSLNESKYEIIHTLIELINYVSIFVSVILGFLIVYSNNFLIRRRKKEIGLYYTLGMSKRKVSFILVIETLMVGFISLVIGLLCGVFLSQFLSLFVAKLFEVNMTSFKFVFSSLAFNKTILYFGLIFLLVMVFNILTLSRYKLIDLITAEKKNEQVKIRNKYLTIISFILCVIFLGYAYYMLIHENAILMMDNKMLYMVISGALGTFLLFFSLSGFLLKVIQRIKRIYYKNLNIFTLKQVNSKINTSVISTSVICLMLLLTIGMLSGSLSLAHIFNEDVSKNNLTDYTINSYGSNSYLGDSGLELLPANKYENFDKIFTEEYETYSKEYVLFHKYADPSFVTQSLMTKADKDKLIEEYGSNLNIDYNVTIIPESEYIEYMKLINEKIIDIKDGKYLLIANIDLVLDTYENHYEEKIPIQINGKILTPATDKIIEIAFGNSNSNNNDGIIVVEDDVVENLELLGVSILGNFVKNNDDGKIGDEFYSYLSGLYQTWPTGIGFDYRSKTDMETASIGLKTMVIFIGLYLGITFAVSSATVLAIGQLSESSDNRKRYKVLKQIGSDDKMINKALFTQISITFLFPLVVALIHAYFGLKELNSIIVSIGSVDLTSNILLTTLFMVIVYGGYFLATYYASKNIIKEK